MQKKVALAVWMVAALVACSDDETPAPAQDAGQEAGQDAGQDTGPGMDVEEDVQAPDAAPDMPVDPGLTEGTVEAGGTSVAVSFAPFSLTVRRGEEVLGSSYGGDEVAYRGLEIAIAPGFTETRWYDPELNQGDIDEVVVWYQAAEVRQGRARDDGFVFDVATRAEDGTDGPVIQLTLSPEGASPQLRVVVDAPGHVFTNLVMAASDSEAFYGLGEQFDRLNSRGLVRDMQTQAEGDSESATNEVHVPVHLMISTARYALFLDDRAPAAFDVAATHDGAVRVTSASSDAAYRFFSGDTPMEILETYAAIAGLPAQVPHWALAPQWWRNVSDTAEVLDDARRSRAMGYPTSILWIDRPWSSYYHNWRFNEVLFPDAEEMFAELRALGYRVVLHHSPQMNPPGSSDLPAEDASEGLFAQFLDNGWLVSNNQGAVIQFPWGGGNGGFVDWSHHDAVDAVETHIERVTSLGAVGTKMDWDEYLQPNIQDIRIHLDYHNGETNFTMRQWYSALYHKAIIEAFNNQLGTQSFHVARSGVQRDQQWSTCIWPGDLDNDFSEHTRGPSERQEEWNVGGMPAAIVANQSLGMSGYPCFASDIGGYRNGRAEEEVLLRWVAFGTFNGVMQLGGSSQPHMPWAVDTPYTEALADVTLKYFRLRMDLVPYIYAQFVQAHRTGRPVVRALWLHHPEDMVARNYERDFYFGPDFLVAPIYTEGATERTHYIPEGEFVDFWTGEALAGPQERTVPAPIDFLPVLVRRGAIVPMAAGDIDTMWPEEDPEIVSYGERSLTRLYVVPAPGAAESFYNGVDVQVADDAASLLVSVSAPDPALDPAMAFAPEEVAVDIVLPEAPTAVLINGEACEACWEWNASRRLLQVAPRATPLEVVYQ